MIIVAFHPFTAAAKVRTQRLTTRQNKEINLSARRSINETEARTYTRGFDTARCNAPSKSGQSGQKLGKVWAKSGQRSGREAEAILAFF